MQFPPRRSFTCQVANVVFSQYYMYYTSIHICSYILQIYLPFAALLSPVQRAGGRGADISTQPRTSLRRIFCDIKLEKYNKGKKVIVEGITKSIK